MSAGSRSRLGQIIDQLLCWGDWHRWEYVTGSDVRGEVLTFVVWARCKRFECAQFGRWHVVDVERKPYPPSIRDALKR